MAEPAQASADESVSYRKARDEEVVAAITKVVLREGQVSSQRELHALVTRALRARNAQFSVTPERVRHLALRSGIVRVQVRTRKSGHTPVLEQCPVCATKLKRSTSRTLQGTTTSIGYKCPRCPWWTGREYRVPQHYTFIATVESGGRGQATFNSPRALDRRPRSSR